MSIPEFIEITVAPRLEWSQVHHRVRIPLGVGFKAAMVDLLRPTVIPSVGSDYRKKRTCQKVPMEAKLCAKSFLGYHLLSGQPRGSSGKKLDSWSVIPLDLDGVPTSVADLQNIVKGVFNFKCAWYPSWSCKDNDARMRGIVVLPRTVSGADACDIWWYLRMKLIEAGIPERGQTKTGKKGEAIVEPCLDPRFDTKPYYLPSLPENQTPGTEGWGGTMPRLAISEDDAPLIDIDLAIKEGREYGAKMAPWHAAEYVVSRCPTPSVAGKSVAKVGKSKSSTSSKGGSKSGSGVGNTKTCDFSSVKFEGSDLRSWALAHLEPGREISISSPWKADGGNGAQGGSCRLHLEDDGSLWAHDFSSGDTFFDLPAAQGEVFGFSEVQPKNIGGTTMLDVLGSDRGSAPNSSKKNQVNSTKARQPEAGVFAQLQANQGVKKYFDQDLIQGRFLRAMPLTRKFTFIRAPHGRGKTELVAKLINWTHQRTEANPILSVVHRRNLGRQQASRLGLPNYEDMGGTISTDAIVCLDSIRRVSCYNFRPDGIPEAKKFGLVILDEADQLIHHLYGGTLSGPASLEAAEQLRLILACAEQVVLLSADIDPATIKMFRTLRGVKPDEAQKDEELRWLDVPHERPWRLDVDSSRTDRDLFGEWAEDKNLAIHAQSRRECGRLAQQLQDIRPDAKILLITSETTGNKDVAAFLRDPSLASSYNAIVYSPSLGTGYSIDLKDHFHRVYAYSRAGVGIATDLVQGAMRVRHPIETEIRCSCPMGGEGASREVDPAKIYTALITLGDATSRLIGVDGPQPTAAFAVGSSVVDDDGVVRLDPWRTWHTHLYSQVLSRERLLGGPGGSRHRALTSYLKSIGAVVEITDPLEAHEAKEHKEAAKEARAEVKDQRAERIEAAEILTIAEARKIVEPKDQAQSDAIERAYILDFYGEASKEVIVADDEGKLRAEARAFARMEAWVKDPASIVSLDKWERENGYPASHTHHYTVNARLFKKILGAAGLSGSPSSWGGTVLDPAKIGPEVAREAKKYKSLLGELKVGVRRDVETNPITLISTILGKLGLKLNERKNHGNRTYVISENRTQLMVSVSARYLGRVLDRDPAGRLVRDPAMEDGLVGWEQTAPPTSDVQGSLWELSGV